MAATSRSSDRRDTVAEWKKAEALNERLDRAAATPSPTLLLPRRKSFRAVTARNFVAPRRAPGLAKNVSTAALWESRSDFRSFPPPPYRLGDRERVAPARLVHERLDRRITAPPR